MPEFPSSDSLETWRHIVAALMSLRRCATHCGKVQVSAAVALGRRTLAAATTSRASFRLGLGAALLAISGCGLLCSVCK